MSVARRPAVRRQLLIALGAAAALLLGLVAVPPAQAGPINTNWEARRVGVNLPGPGDTLTSTPGDVAAATMSYNVDHAGFQTRSWDFTATADESSADGTPIKVPYTWQGLHAWFNVTARLDLVVNGTVEQTLVNAGPAICCTTPSNGFLYGGVAEFNVHPGDTYGFRLSGSNGDSNDFLRGTFTLSTKPYIDATLGQDNRQWTGATTLPAGGGLDGVLAEAGEARWFRIPVVPGQRVAVDLTELPGDYDLALYGDIQAAFDRLTADPLSQQSLTQLSAGQSSASAVTASQVPNYLPEITRIPDKDDPEGGASFSPRVYSPRVYSPRVYSPRVYSPRVYSPRVYSPDSYDPTLSGDQAFQDAFSGAQTQTLLAVSAKSGRGSEAVSAATGNTQGFFYVRVQGHDDQVFSADPFHVSRSVEGGEACQGLETFEDDSTMGPTRNDATTVIVTDSSQVPYEDGDDADTFTAALTRLADATDGVVVDVADSERAQDLASQARRHNDCPYAMNLVANEIKSIVDQYRNDNSKYVVIAGNDDVVPFFRYPDLSGLGQESEFDPGLVNPNNPSYGSLSNDQVLSQDAYGARTSLIVGGSSVPVPDLAVGRLVETSGEIEDTIDHFVAPSGDSVRALPRPTSSLVTGYDFLADAAHAVQTEFRGALGSANQGNADAELIDEPGTPFADAWTADDLEDKLLGARHDLIYLAGHFSANNTLAADFDTTLEADVLDPANFPDDAPLPLEDSLVLSAGCHSAYNTVDDVSSFPPDWAQRMAQQHALLIGGTGYQYGDTDFLEYSERLYLQVARELRRGTAGTPVAIGNALVQAKQDYLASLATLSGIDEKSVLEATMYGLPMTGVDMAGRTGNGSGGTDVTPIDVTTGPGAVLGLSTRDRTFPTPLEHHSDKPSHAPDGLPTNLDWYQGADGVTVVPGDPALPKQVEDVTSTGTVLRGVGFRSGTYEQNSGVLPLTGAPAVEGTTPHSTFASETFYPQRMLNVNYFDALGARGSGGRTSLVLSPAQYRSDDGADTNTVRAYSDMGVRMFYSGNTTTFTGGNQPAQAVAPAIGGVSGSASGGVVTFSVQATGDPSAGVQQVWITWTSGPDGTGHGRWQSVDLQQDDLDSTLWNGTLDLPNGVQRSEVRFLVQAANGAGVVGLDAAEGDGYRVTAAGVDTAAVGLVIDEPVTPSHVAISGVVTDDVVSIAGRAVRFTVSSDGTVLFDKVALTNAAGVATMPLDPGEELPVGEVTVVADLLSATGDVVVSTDRAVVTVVSDSVPSTLTSTLPWLATRAGRVYPVAPRVRLTNAGAPVPGVAVTFTLPTTGPRATFPRGRSTYTGTTNAQGYVSAPRPTAASPVGSFAMSVSAADGTAVSVPMAAQYALAAFGAPVRGSGVTSLASTRSLTLTTRALLANGARLGDAAAAALVAAGRVQVVSIPVSGAATTSRTDLATYDARGDLFRAVLTPSQMGWTRGQRYLVGVRILPDPASSPVDLGSRWFALRIT